MRRFFATRATTGNPSLPGTSLRARMLSLLCLFLVVLGSTVQAVHTHGVGLPDRSVHAGSLQPGVATPDDSACPLCAAMHSALPAAAPQAYLRLVLRAAEVAPSALAFVAETVHFAGFSRPPPPSRVLLG